MNAWNLTTGRFLTRNRYREGTGRVSADAFPIIWTQGVEAPTAQHERRDFSDVETGVTGRSRRNGPRWLRDNRTTRKLKSRDISAAG